MTAVPGTEYALTFYYARDDLGNSESQCVVSAVYDYYTMLKEVHIPYDTEYHQYSARFIATAPNPAIEIRIACPYVGNGEPTVVYVDDVFLRNPAGDCDTTLGDPTAPPKPTLISPASPEAPRCPVELLRSPSFDPIPNDSPSGFYGGPGSIEEGPLRARTGDYLAYDCSPP